jgi:hypothetical protein
MQVVAARGTGSEATGSPCCQVVEVSQASGAGGLYPSEECEDSSILALDKVPDLELWVSHLLYRGRGRLSYGNNTAHIAVCFDHWIVHNLSICPGEASLNRVSSMFLPSASASNILFKYIPEVPRHSILSYKNHYIVSHKLNYSCIFQLNY